MQDDTAYMMAGRYNSKEAIVNGMTDPSERMPIALIKGGTHFGQGMKIQ